MADDILDEDEDLDLAPADAGVLFRAEMATTNFFLGYWPYIVGAIVAVLASILVYGQYKAYVVRGQQATAGRIAEVESTLPGALIELPSMMAGEVPGAETDDIEPKLLEAARALDGIAAEASRAARVEARLKAAELYRLGGDAAARRASLEDAVVHAEGILAYSAAGALANLDLEEGNGDAAVDRWKQLVETQQGYLAEQAMLELGLALEALDRDAEAATVYADFLSKFPESPRVETARQRQSRVQAAG